MIIEFRTKKGAPIPIPAYTSKVWSALTAHVGQNYRDVHIKTGVLNQSGPQCTERSIVPDAPQIRNDPPARIAILSLPSGCFSCSPEPARCTCNHR